VLGSIVLLFLYRLIAGRCTPTDIGTTRRAA
jgi:hypothetical protein